MSDLNVNSEKSQRFQINEKNKVKEMLSKFGSVLGLLILCIVLTFASPTFLTVKNVMNIASQAAITCLISLGMLVTILTAGIDLSVGSILALSTCIMGVSFAKWHINPLLAMIVCLLMGICLGFLNGIMLTKLRLPHPFISTMGTKNVARGLALVVTAASPISGFPKAIQYLGAGSIGVVPVSLIVVIICSIAFSIFLNRTVQGRHVYAVGGNKESAKLSGVNVDRTLVVVYVLSGLMSAVAGIVLTGRVNAAFPLAGLDYDSDAIAACIIGGTSFMGGVGNVSGTLIGAIIMAVLRNGLNLLNVSPDLQTVAIGIVIIGAVYVDVLRNQVSRKVKIQA